MTEFQDVFSKEIWEQTYKYYEDTTVDDTFRRVAKAAASVEKKELQAVWEENFFDMLSDFKVTTGGRIYSNAGTDYQGTTLFNCFVSPFPPYDVDSLKGILQVLEYQALTLKSEGGWGMNFSFIRPRGSFIKGIGVESPGSVKYMEIFDKSSDIVTSGSGKKSDKKEGKKKIRKGAMMSILDVWHPDVVEFITAKQHQGRLTKFNMSVNCTNPFMDKVLKVSELENIGASEEEIKEYDNWDLMFPDSSHPAYKSEWKGDIEDWKSKDYPVEVFETVSVRWLWNLITESTYNRAEPGIMFLDRAQQLYPTNYSNKVVASNPCIGPDSLVETINGRVRIADIKEPTKVYTMLEDGSLGIRNSSAAWCSKRNAETLKITTNSDKELICTPDHLIYVDGVGWKKAEDLRVGEKLVHLCRSRRGVAYSGIKLSTQANNEYQMEHRLVAESVWGKLSSNEDVHHIDNDTYNNSIDNLEVLTHSEHSTLTRYESLNNHQKKDCTGKFIAQNSGYEKTIIPMPSNLSSNMKNQNSACIKSIEKGPTTDVYDLHVEDTHNFIADFIVVHNCGEQILPFGGICNLASINLTQFVDVEHKTLDFERIKQFARYGVRFLDNISDLSNYPLKEYEEFAKNYRRVGLGVLGWGSALYMLKIRFGSDEATKLRDELMRTISHEVYDYSVDLAKEKGMFPECDPIKHAETAFVMQIELPENTLEKMRKYGIRNSSLMSQQPTGNTSIFANVVSGGIEPVFMPEYTRTVIESVVPGEIKDVTPKYWEGEWKETKLFKFDKEGDEDILRGEFNGTTYKIDKNRGLTKEVLCEDYGVRWLKSRGEWDANAVWAVSTAQLTPEEHINDLMGFSKYTDSSISKTINLPNDFSFDKFKGVYTDAYKSGYIKGCTTYRSGTMASVLSGKKEEDEEIIQDHVKLPESAEASLKTIKAEGKKWYLTVTYFEGTKKPFALFVKTNASEKSVVTNNALDILEELAVEKGIPMQHIRDTIEKTKNDANVSKITRIISLLLRHGVLIKNIVSALDRVDGAYVGTFIFQIKKFLSTYIKDGEKAEGEVCQECGSEKVIFQEGCKVCSSCGSSKCG